jgi:hypothetical protein
MKSVPNFRVSILGFTPIQSRLIARPDASCQLETWELPLALLPSRLVITTGAL